jgi:hypothetical protein
MQQYDSDEEWAAMLSPSMSATAGLPHGLSGDSNGQRFVVSEPELVVVTATAGVGLTAGARLPDAILLPADVSDEEA